MASQPNHSGTTSSRSSREHWAIFIAAGCALVILLALLAPRMTPARREMGPDRTLSQAHLAAGAFQSPRLSPPAPTPEQIVQSKVDEFARDRLRILRAMAKGKDIELPPEAERFFNAVAQGRWDDLNDLYKSLEALRDSPEGEKLRSLWGPILETLLIAECAHLWPAQKLLDYGQATIGSLPPGTVYVGGTDPGRGIPTLLNETSQGDRHIVITQNGLADGSYLDYLKFLYNDQMTLPSEEQVTQAFNDYVADAQKRFEHDRQFPDEPKQVRPGEDIQAAEGSDSGAAGGTNHTIVVSGQVAVMSINERILKTVMDNNPGMSFALEESFPLASTYSSAVPLGPIMELRVPDAQNAFTTEAASKSVDYWRATAQSLASDDEAPEGSEVRKTYSHMASAQANLLASHDYTGQAEQTYRLAMAMEPGNPEPIYGLAGLLDKTERGDEARQLLNNFFQTHPNITAPPVPSIIVGGGQGTH